MCMCICIHIDSGADRHDTGPKNTSDAPEQLVIIYLLVKIQKYDVNLANVRILQQTNISARFSINYNIPNKFQLMCRYLFNES